MSAAASPGLAIAGEMNIYRAGELKEAVLALVAASAPSAIAVDLSGVSELDTAGLQILLLGRRAATARGGALRLVDPSPAVREVLALAGLLPTFDVAGA